MRRILSPAEGGTLRKLLAVMFCLQLGVAGCAMRGGRASANQRGERCACANGVLAPFLLLGILIIASDVKVMNGQTSSILGKAVVALTTQPPCSSPR